MTMPLMMSALDTSEAENSSKLLTVIRLISPLVAVWGMSLETYHVIRTDQFDMQSFFEGTLYFFGGLSLILGGNQLTDFLKGKNQVAAQKTSGTV